MVLRMWYAYFAALADVMDKDAKSETGMMDPREFMSQLPGFPGADQG